MTKRLTGKVALGLVTGVSAVAFVRRTLDG